MDPIVVASAQFENSSKDKAHNLKQIDLLAGTAAGAGAKMIAFHECSVTGYSFARSVSKEALLAVAEVIPGGDSIAALREISHRHRIVVLAGLFERDEKDNIYNTYVAVDKDGLVARHRKLHPFIHPDLVAGDSYTVFDLFGWRFGILTCYDNNIIENVRATVLLGASVIFMPHVTMCTPSTRPGAGFVDPSLWKNRVHDPTPLRLEFDGMKGRSWLMKWLPARAYDNGIYVVFSNPIGMDEDQLKNGCSMIVDPFGDILAECRTLGDEVVTATLFADHLEKSGGHRYIQARRPELYGAILGNAHNSLQKVAWLDPSVTGE